MLLKLKSTKVFTPIPSKIAQRESPPVKGTPWKNDKTTLANP